MSHNDSFIDEVTEEVRRDRLFRLARRYGWIVILALVLIVGAASYHEWRKAEARADAEKLGDSLLAATAIDDRLGRATALQEITTDPGTVPVGQFLAAADLAASDPERAGELLEEIAAKQDIPALFRDLAVLKLVMIPDLPMMSDARLARLEPLTTPGAPFRLAAMEQSASIHIERKETDEALTILRAILNDAEASGAVQQRAQQLIVALGGTFEDT